jgi:hypothetical protein
MEILGIGMEVIATTHTAVMDASTIEEMATTIHHHNGHKGHNNHKSVRGNGHNHGGNNGYDRSKDNHFVKKDIS